jgi:hypothetical protein
MSLEPGSTALLVSWSKRVSEIGYDCALKTQAFCLYKGVVIKEFLFDCSSGEL